MDSFRRAALRSWACLVCPIGVAILFVGCGPRSEPVIPPPTATSPAPATTTAPSEQSQAELAASFDSAGAILLEAKTADDFSKFQALREATLAPTPTGLRVTSSGTDPQVLLPAFAQGQKFIVQIVIEAPFDTPCQVFYQLADKPGFVEAQSRLVPLKKGKNTVYCKVDVNNVIDPVRVDPGASPGDYVIESVVARATNVAKP